MSSYQSNNTGNKGNKVARAYTPYCSFCKSLGKPEDVYTSHSIHKTKSQNSQIMCPELWKNVCLDCSSRNHTADRCHKLLGTKSTTAAAVQLCVQVAKKSKFAELELESDDEDIQQNEPDNKFAIVDDDDW